MVVATLPYINQYSLSLLFPIMQSVITHGYQGKIPHMLLSAVKMHQLVA